MNIYAFHMSAMWIVMYYFLMFPKGLEKHHWVFAQKNF